MGERVIALSTTKGQPGDPGDHIPDNIAPRENAVAATPAAPGPGANSLPDLADLIGLDAGAILIDAPLAFKTWSKRGEGRSPQHHYNCPGFDALAAMPVAQVAARDAFLFLWVPLRSMPVVEPLMHAWGFKFSASAFVWAKPNKKKPGWFAGSGYTTRKNAEVCWLGRRGRPKRLSKKVDELIVAPRREYSRKPDAQYSRIEQYCSGPYLELFARQRLAGWISWGDEVDRFEGLA